MKNQLFIFCFSFLSCCFLFQSAYSQTPIACDGDVTASLSVANEQDTYTFNADPGDVVIIRMAQDNAPISPKLQLTGPGVNQTNIGSTVTPARIGAIQLSGGSYTITASGNGGNFTGNYGLSLQIIEPSCATPIGCTDDVNGSLGKKAEMDAFTFEVSVEDKLVIARMMQDGSPISSRLELYRVGDPNIKGEDDGTTVTPARINAGNLTPGTYVLLAMEEKGAFTGNYGLSVQFVKAACATPIGCMDDVNGSLGKKAEMDAFTFEVSAEDKLVIARMMQDGSPISSRLELYLVGDPNIKGEHDGSTVTPARINAENLTPGTYVLLAMEEKGVFTGNYGLSVQFVKAACATPIGCMDDVNGSLGKKAEMDAFTFEVSAEDKLVIARMMQDGSPISSRLELYLVGDPNIKEEDDGTTVTPARINAENLTSGTYVLLAMEEKGAFIGDYGLSLQFVKAACATPIGCTDDVNGNLGKKAEMDAYTFEVTPENKWVVARMMQDGSPISARLELYRVGDPSINGEDDGTTVMAARLSAYLVPGTYVLLAMEEKGAFTGNYGLSVQLVSAACANSLSCDGDLSGSLDKKAEMDAFAFPVVPGDAYIFKFHGTGISEYRLEFYDQTGNELSGLTQNIGNSDTLRLDLSPANFQGATGVTLLVMDKNGVYTGGYDLSVQRLRPACAQLLACGEDVKSSLALASQMNAYALPVQPGDRFILRSLEKVALAQLHLEFFHADGSPWTEMGDVFSNGMLQSFTFDFDAVDTLLIVASDAGINHAIAEFGLSVQLLRPDCAVELSCPADLSGNFLKPAQTEAFWFEVFPGQRYIIRAKATGSGFNGQFQLFTPAGDLHSQVINNTLTFNDILDIPGAWMLLLTEQDGDAVGAYTISFLAVGKPSCSVELACGQALSGNLSTASSLRQFRLTGAQNQKLIVRARGAIGSGVTPLLQLYKANGQQIGADATARREDAFDVAGEFFLVVSDNSSASAGNFHLAAQNANDFTCGESIFYNQTLTNSLGSQVEMDGFVFSGNQGDVVSISAGVCSGTFDAQVELWNAGGLLQKMDFTDNGLARIDTFRLLTSGSYKLLVMEKEGDETTGEYGICLQKVNPGVNAAALFPGTATVSVLSKPAEMQVFTFYSEAGTPATLTMNALSGNLQPRLELFAPGGARLALQTGITTASINNFPLPATGTYSVLALPANPTPCGTGDFDLKLQAILFANPTQFNVACEGGSLSISIISNCPNWTLSPTAGWQGDPVNGSYNQTVSVGVEQNSSLLARTGTMILTGCGISQTLTVTQTGATFSASPLSYSVGNEAGQVLLDLTSACCAWQVTSNNPGWLTASPTTGIEDETVVISFEENTSVNPRPDTLTLTGCDGVTYEIEVVQAGINAVLNVNPTHLDLGASAGSTNIEVTGNCNNWTISGAPAWLQVTPTTESGDQSVALIFQANPDCTDRTATLFLSGCNITKEITVNQAGEVVFAASPSFIYVGSGAGSTSFEIFGNCDGWAISGGAPLVTSIFPTSGNSLPQSILINFSANPDSSELTVILTVTCCGEPYEVTVTQAGIVSITATPGLVICPGQTTQLCATPGSAYEWSNGQPSQCIMVGSEGTYSVTVTNANGIGQSATVFVSMPQPVQPVIALVGDDQLQATGNGTAWQWFQDGNPIAGATGQLFTPGNLSGLFTVVAFLGGCESEPSAPFFFSNETTPTLEVGRLRVMPNPATQIFWVEIPGNVPSGSQLVLSDVAGRVCRALLVKAGERMPVQREGLADGLYFLQLKTQAGQTLATGRVVLTE